MNSGSVLTPSCGETAMIIGDSLIKPMGTKSFSKFTDIFGWVTGKITSAVEVGI